MKKISLTLPLISFFGLFLTAQVRFEKEFNFAPANSYFYEWTEIDGKMYFSADDGYFGQELWQFDPATEQATRLTDLRATSGSSSPHDIFKYDDKIFFIADTDEHDGQIFSFDPQTYDLERVSTFLDIGFGARNAAVYNGKFWFTLQLNGTTNLWNYDASTGTFTEVPAPAGGNDSSFNPGKKGVFNGQLYFLARNTDNKWVLWSYDDQAGIFTYEPSQFDENEWPVWNIEGLQECGGELMLYIGLGPSNNKWYHYDFEQDSCLLLSDNNSGNYRGGHCLQDKFWSVESLENEIEIYDPATGQTELLGDILPSFLGNPVSIKAIGDDLYIWRRNFNTPELSKYDPVENEITDLFIEEDVNTEMATLMVHEGDFYFFGEKSFEKEVYKASPGDVGATLIADINQVTADGFWWTSSHHYQPFGDRVYFQAIVDDDPISREIWAIDTTDGGFFNISESLTDGSRVQIVDLSSVVIDGRWYFSGAWVDGEFRQLVSYAPGEDSLRWHGNIPSTVNTWVPALGGLTRYGDDILLGGFRDFTSYPQLHRFEVASQTFELLPGTEEVTGKPLFVIGDKLFFEGRYVDNLNIKHYFELDLVTHELTELINGSLTLYSYQPFLVGDKVACGVKNSSQTITHIMLYDPATGEKKYLLPDGFDSVLPNFPVQHEGKTWFWWNGQGSSSLFTIDPMTDSCEVVLTMGPEVSAGGELIWFDDKLYFHGRAHEIGREVLEYEPATGVVRPYADIFFGPGNGWPEEFVVIGDRLYFTATDGRRGHELWSLGNCFEVTTSAVSDSLGQGEGQITLTLEGGVEPFTFEWNNGATTQHIDGLSTGYYEVTVTDAEGCGATVAVLLDGGAVTSVWDKSQLPAMKIYPNPASDFIRLEMEKMKGEMTAMFYSFSGVEMRRENIRSQVTELDVADFPSGIYFLVIKNEKGKFTVQKIIVER